MEKEDFLLLIEKYQQNTITQEEEDMLLAYYELFDHREDVLAKLGDKEKGEIRDSIKSRLDDIVSLTETNHNIRKKNHFWKLSIAAALILVSSIGFWLYQKEKESQYTLDISYTKNDYVAPGKDDAILTLADGSKMVLSNKDSGIILSELGVSIQKGADGEISYLVNKDAVSSTNRIETPRGGKYRVTLSDGTKVWLNSESSIRFPTVFEKDKRIVEISGEAYFEVTKNATKPFYVFSEHQLIEVLGTSFNVNTYPDETLNKTTLLEGKIKLSKLNRDKTINTAEAKILLPGQQALLSPITNHIVIDNIDVEDDVAWKNGYFKFNRDDLQTIMRQVSRWYDVDVEYRGAVPRDLFNGEIKREDDIEQVLKILRLNNIKVTLKGRKVVINN